VAVKKLRTMSVMTDYVLKKAAHHVDNDVVRSD